MAKPKVTPAEIHRRLEGRPLTMLEYAGSVLGKSRFRCHVCEHEWLASADNITRGRGCPQCKLQNSRLDWSYAETRMQRMGFTLVQYTKATEPVKVRCTNAECGHEVEKSNLQHIEHLQGCRKCWERERGLLPEQVRETLLARNIELLHHAGNTSDKSKYRCLVDGHEWETNLGDVLAGQGCRKCAGLVPLTADDVSEKLQGRDIELLQYGGSTASQSRFRCSEGHEWETTVNSVVSRESGCSVCAGMFTYTFEQVAEIAKQQGLILLSYGGGVNSRSLFKCPHDGYEWYTTISNIKRSVAACPRCGNREPYSLDKMLKCLEGRQIRLLQFIEGSASYSSFSCTAKGCGHKWKATNGSVGNGSGCAKCAGVLTLTEQEARQKAATRPELTLVTYAGTSENDDTLWHCNKCEHEWKAPVGRVFGTNRSGCPNCAETGFRPGKPALFYAYHIQVAGKDYLGYGITGNIEVRDYYHGLAFAEANATGELLWTIEHDSGELVRTVEAEVKSAFPVHNSGVTGFLRECTSYTEDMVKTLKQYVFGRLHGGLEPFTILELTH